MKEKFIIKLRCATCGCDDHFEFNEDRSYVKCTFCNREYIGGIEELQELNETQLEKVREEIKQDSISHIHNELQDAFKGNKFIKFSK